MPLALLLTAFLSTLAHAAPDYKIFEAKHGSRAPTLLFVHGGAWIGGDKSEYEALGKSFAEKGICVATLNYGLAPEHMHPAQTKDLDAAIVDLVKKKKQGPCNFEKLYLAGHSAGAHTIAYWATAYKNPAVKGFIGLEGIYDLPLLAKRFPTYSDWFLKKEFGIENVWTKASPSNLELKAKAPWLLIQSDQDELVDRAQSKGFEEHLKQFKIPVTYLALPSGKHDEVIRKLGNPGEASTQAVEKFLRD